MAQTTSSSSTRSKRTGSRAGRPTSRNGTSKTKRTSSNSGGARTSRRTTSSAGRSRSSTSRSRPSASAARGRSSSTNGPIAQAGEKVSNVASKAKTPLVAVSKAKTPLIAAGAALAGIAGGVALKSRNNQRNPMKRLRAPSMPKALKNVDLSKIDLDSITSAANRVRSLGEQVGDVADAADKTRKKHN